MIVASITEPELGILKIKAPKGKRYNVKEFRNKFNGKLVMKWVGCKPGPLLAETIEEFYIHVISVYKISVPEYFMSRTPSCVRLDFLDFYDPIGALFGDRLPY